MFFFEGEDSPVRRESMTFVFINALLSKAKYYLQVQSSTLEKRTSQCSLPGSMTVEAAVAVPLFLFFIYGLLCTGQMLLTNAEVSRSLTQTARQTAKLYYLSELTEEQGEGSGRENLISGDGQTQESGGVTVGYAAAKARFMSMVDSGKLSGVRGGAAGISLAGSRVLNSIDEVELKAGYFYEIPVPVIGNRYIHLRCCAVSKAYTGRKGGFGLSGAGGEYVCVTEHGSVYHDDPGCTYISISVKRAGDPSLAGRPVCRHCRGSDGSGYVTVYGDVIHTNRSCSSINRTVRLVPKSQTGNMRRCSRCGKNHRDSGSGG